MSDPKETAKAAGAAETTAGAPQPLPQFPAVPMAYVMSPQLGMAYPGMQAPARQPVRFQTIGYLPTPYGYLPFALDVIK